MVCVPRENEYLVSAVLMSYNQKEYILLHLDNILNQDFQGSMEAIITDDASTDGTVYAIKEYCHPAPAQFSQARTVLSISPTRIIAAKT